MPNDDPLIALARECGLMVILDGQIGREKYQSVSGPLDALSRFAERCRQEVDHPNAGAALGTPH
ncbi:hypothetical protein KDW82_08395 [Burkholderia vietnamiensis]|nr:hypothetical protein [Burkholderia vietnamiensis]MBR8189077.1 hypothetical protein [Burkholderia vietnamiensis]HDR9174298.1 hypothetical protein [Burkholderia vietnamiensis]